MVRFIICRKKDYTPKSWYLHSNMVRFIIKRDSGNGRDSDNIYIPIWLDLLFDLSHNHFTTINNLHSNMVRFIIKRFRR